MILLAGTEFAFQVGRHPLNELAIR